jgi:hypothetical protein
MFDNGKAIQALAPYGVNSICQTIFIDGPGNALVLAWTGGDQVIALLNQNYSVVWCYSTGSSSTENHFLELEYQIEKRYELPRAAWHLDHDRPEYLRDVNQLWRKLGAAIVKHKADEPPREYNPNQYRGTDAPGYNFPDHAVIPTKPAVFDDRELIGKPTIEKEWQELEGLIHTMPYGEHEEAKAGARAALGAAGALGSATLPASVPPPLESARNGNAGLLVRGQAPNTPEANALLELAEAINSDPEGMDEEAVPKVDIKLLERYFWQRQAGFTVTDNGNGFRLWYKNQYIGHWEGRDGMVSMQAAREADKALTDHQLNN